VFKSRAAERPERDTWLALHRRVVLDETAPPPPPEPMEITEVFDSSLNKKWTERAFRVTVADGAVAGDLVADARKGKNQAAPELTLTLVDQTGTVVDSASGTSVTVTAEVTAGDYTWEVSGPSARFSLTVTYLTE
jgi:MinD superfamily P-loop ATPase